MNVARQYIKLRERDVIPNESRHPELVEGPPSSRERSRAGLPQLRGHDELGMTEGEMTVTHTEYLTIRTERRYEIRDITEEVERVRAAAGLWDGFVLVSTMHGCGKTS